MLCRVEEVGVCGHLRGMRGGGRELHLRSQLRGDKCQGKLTHRHVLASGSAQFM